VDEPWTWIVGAAQSGGRHAQYEIGVVAIRRASKSLVEAANTQESLTLDRAIAGGEYGHLCRLWLAAVECK
jgi:hypothetical protein